MNRPGRGALLSAAAFVCLASSAKGSSESSDAALLAVQAELAATKKELADTKETLHSIVDRLDQLEASRTTSPVGGTPVLGVSRVPPLNVDNPAISFVIDTTLTSQGADPGTNFALRSGELFLSAPIDPFLRGYVDINGTSDEGFDIEEAALVTTSLPWNLTVKGGRFFADFGRFSHWHDEALPFVDRPPSLDRIIGGESGAEGVELTWLAPLEQFVQVTAGVYNAIGSQRREELRDQGFDGKRVPSELTWLVHPSTYFDLSDSLSAELGGSFATVPQNGQRRLYGFDFTLRHQPGTSAFYQGFVLGSEWLWNREKFGDVEVGFDADSGEPVFASGRFDRNGGYAYLETFWGRRFSLGLRGDVAEEIAGPDDEQLTASLFGTWQPSEFQRLRLQGDLIDRDDGNDQRITLQWTAFLGSHSHGFATR